MSSVYYVLLTSGEVERKEEKTTIDELVKKYFPNGSYLAGFPPDENQEVTDHFFLMDEVNDLPETRKKSTLGKNKYFLRYYPNSEFTGPIVVIRMDENDNLIPGQWDLTSVPFEKYVYGGEGPDFRLESLKREEVVPTRGICEICNRPKEVLGHYMVCAKYRTSDILNRVKEIIKDDQPVTELIRRDSEDFFQSRRLTWDRFIDYPNIEKKSLDKVCLEWCNLALKYYQRCRTNEEKQLVLDNILAILYSFEESFSFIDKTGKNCPFCQKDPVECAEILKTEDKELREYLDTVLTGDEKFSEKLKQQRLYLTHSSHQMFLFLLSSFRQAPDSLKKYPGQLIYYLADTIYDMIELETLIQRADSLIGF